MPQDSGVPVSALNVERMQIDLHLAAAHEDGREILYDVGMGIIRVYPIDSQYLVDQRGKSG